MLLAVSMATGKNVTIEQCHESLFPLMLMHHTASASLCALGLHIGTAHSGCSGLSAMMLISMLGSETKVLTGKHKPFHWKVRQKQLKQAKRK